MNRVVPSAFTFRYAFPVSHVLKKRGRAAIPISFEEVPTLPHPAGMDDGRAFGDVQVVWNEDGLGVRAVVRGRLSPIAFTGGDPLRPNCLQVWIDTRDTQSIHRASRFCHWFCLNPGGSGKNRDKPHGVELAIPRAREEHTLATPDEIAIDAKMNKGGYELTAWLPREILTGYDPRDNSRLGFYYALEDGELGEQTLSVNRDFPYATDPSLWCTLELLDPAS